MKTFPMAVALATITTRSIQAQATKTLDVGAYGGTNLSHGTWSSSARATMVAFALSVALVLPMAGQTVDGRITFLSREGVGVGADYQVHVSQLSPSIVRFLRYVCSFARAEYRSTLSFVERVREEVESHGELLAALQSHQVAVGYIDRAGSFTFGNLPADTVVFWAQSSGGGDVDYGVLDIVELTGVPVHIELIYNAKVSVLATVCSLDLP